MLEDWQEKDCVISPSWQIKKNKNVNSGHSGEKSQICALPKEIFMQGVVGSSLGPQGKQQWVQKT